MARFVERTIRQLGAKQVFGGQECGLSRVLSDADLIAFKRQWLLQQSKQYISSLVAMIESDSLREFKVISQAEYQSVLGARERRSGEIRTDVASGKGNGFGVIAVSSRAGDGCIIEPTIPQRIEALVQLLEPDKDLISDELMGTLRLIRMTSADEAFLAVQRARCSFVVADAQALSVLASALNRERQSFRFAPLWRGADEVSNLTTDIIRRSESDRREQRGQDDLNETLRKEKVSALRSQNGPRARGLMDDVQNYVRALAEGKRPLEESVFPEYRRWLSARLSAKWETVSVASEIVDFGTVEWKGRSLDAIIVRSEIRQRNRILGENRTDCFVFGRIEDAEFSMWRDDFSEMCEASDAKTRSWKIGNKFKSRWNVEALPLAGR